MSRVLYSMERVLNAELPEMLDFFIIAAGADYRAYENLRLLNSLGCRVNTLVVYDFHQRRQTQDKEYVGRYNSYQATVLEELVVVEVDISDPSGCIGTLLDHDVQIEPSKNVGLDISCFTKPFFYVLLKYLARIGLPCVFTFYTQPRAYRFSEENYRSFRSSRGPISVREVPSFPGGDAREKERMLVVLLGFDGDLSAEISETVAPTKVVVINGFPSYEPKFKDISLISNERLVQASNRLMYSRSANPYEIYNTLEDLDVQGDSTAINIAPLGNKPMALGACLYAIHNPKVRVVYPFPQVYENIITDQCSVSWLYRLPMSLNTP